MPVVVAAAQRHDLPVYLDGLGSVTALNTVTIKSRVDGQLVEVDFTEGQDVHKGDNIAVIDPRPYQAALDQAMANLQRDQSQLGDAKANDERRTLPCWTAATDTCSVPRLRGTRNL